MDQVVAQVAAEITGLGLSRVMLWGHSSGAAFALAAAAKLAEAGVEVARVFLGAQLPGDAARRRASVTELTGRSNAEIAAALSTGGGYTELGELDAQRAGQIGAAYRHDCVSAHRYLADRFRPPLSRLGIRGRPGRPARARRRRPLLPAHPPGPSGPGGACSHSLIEGTLTCRTHPWRL
jgi:pimeloyl-ACP methyl ester carboxylesterase